MNVNESRYSNLIYNLQRGDCLKILKNTSIKNINFKESSDSLLSRYFISKYDIIKKLKHNAVLPKGEIMFICTSKNIPDVKGYISEFLFNGKLFFNGKEQIIKKNTMGFHILALGLRNNFLEKMPYSDINENNKLLIENKILLNRVHNILKSGRSVNINDNQITNIIEKNDDIIFKGIDKNGGLKEFSLNKDNLLKTSITMDGEVLTGNPLLTKFEEYSK